MYSGVEEGMLVVGPLIKRTSAAKNNKCFLKFLVESFLKVHLWEC
jgi:hypothetical protein